MDDNQLLLSELYKRAVGSAPAAVTRLIGSGSARAYYRLEGERNLIGTIGTSVAENRAFLYLDSHFAEAGLNVPTVVAVSDDEMAYLQTDLGDTSLFRLLQFNDQKPDERTRGLLRETIGRLPDIQYKGARSLDFSHCYPVESFDRRSVMWDLNYFKYCFLKISGIEFDEAGLEDDFEHLADLILDDSDSKPTFMYRDFQSRNVMIKENAPWFIDFQGGRRGPALYDLASFLWQARAGFSHELRSELAAVYLESVQRYHHWDADEFNYRLSLFALFRTLQVLGAYGLRGLHEQKPHFIESIFPALNNLKSLSIGLERDFPALSAAAAGILECPLFSQPTKIDGLTVEVNSFGFRAGGIPRDLTGNGGGFVFDCRAITNPGRIQEYMPLTGLDEPVRHFLEDDGEIIEFLTHAKAMVGESVKRYLERGFTSLKVSFGCTGGRHRSVYCAQAMAEWINSEFGVAVDLNHRERGIRKLMPAR